MPKITLEERRLQILRQQLSGKSISSHSKKEHSGPKNSDGQSTLSQTISRVSVNTGGELKEDASYLYWDLIKVFILSLLAIALQGALYFALQMRLFHLWF